MKLMLGTAQFGMDYGVANQSGQINDTTGQEIIALLNAHNVNMLDTAAEYGCSEKTLGYIGVDTFDIVTKLPATMNLQDTAKNWAISSTKASLKRLKRDSIYGLLFHRPSQLLSEHGDDLIDAINELKNTGLIKNFGISIYTPDELPAILEKCTPDIVQAPLNLIDRRLMTSGWLNELQQLDIEVHCRSAFLQGLLLLPRHELPTKFERWGNIFDQWHNWLTDNATDPISACLSIMNTANIDRAIIGIDNIFQGQEILKAYKNLDGITPPNIASNDVDLINPSNWATL